MRAQGHDYDVIPLGHLRFNNEREMRLSLKYILFVAFMELVSSGASLRCYMCPKHERQDLSACLAHAPQECANHENACFFQYEGRHRNMGCGRDWHKPAGCHGTACVKWCHSDMCNKELIKDSPFRSELDQDKENENDPGNWWNSLFGGSENTKSASAHSVSLIFVVVTGILLVL